VNPKYPVSWRYYNPLSSNNRGERSSFANSVSTAIKVFNNSSDITNGALLYYSPISMIPKFSIPDWDFNKLIETTPSCINNERFKFYRYKK